MSRIKIEKYEMVWAHAAISVVMDTDSSEREKKMDLVLVTDGSEVTPVGHHYDNSRGINESRLKRRYLGSDPSLILVWFRFGLWF